MLLRRALIRRYAARGHAMPRHAIAVLPSAKDASICYAKMVVESVKII